MVRIEFRVLLAVLTGLWILVRMGVSLHRGSFSRKRELQLLAVYICIVIVTRFTFFPYLKVDGQIQPLIFDAAKMYPFRTNLVPFANILKYDVSREMWRNLVGNIAMFLPLGIVWPSVFPQLDTPWKAMAAGAGYSLLIELLQLPLYQRTTDVDDLILNTLGFLLGYGICLLTKAIARACRRHRGKK